MMRWSAYLSFCSQGGKCPQPESAHGRGGGGNIPEGWGGCPQPESAHAQVIEPKSAHAQRDGVGVLSQKVLMPRLLSQKVPMPRGGG